MNTLLADVSLSVRARNALNKLGAVTLEDVTKFSEDELVSAPNVGPAVLREIKGVLASHGLRIESDMNDLEYPVTLRYLGHFDGRDIGQEIVVGQMTEDDAKDFVKGLSKGYWYANNKLWIPPHRILELRVLKP